MCKREGVCIKRVCVLQRYVRRTDTNQRRVDSHEQASILFPLLSATLLPTLSHSPPRPLETVHPHISQKNDRIGCLDRKFSFYQQYRLYREVRR